MGFSKKGVENKIIGWLLAIAFAAIILAILMNWSKITNRSVTEQLKCGGIGITDGRCVPSAGDCTGVPIKGLCPGEQWCCESDRVSSSSGSGPRGSSGTGNPGETCVYGSPSGGKELCRVQLKAIKVEISSDYYYIFCTADRKNARCVDAKLVLGEEVPCSFVDEVSPSGSDGLIRFNCGPVPEGSSEFNKGVCTINKGSSADFCVANGPDYIETAALSTPSPSI